MEQDEEKKRIKLKKHESFREVQESIQKYECKREFVEVKLKTSKSFREDQDALNKRFKRKTSEKMQVESQENGHAVENGDMTSRLENIVLELSQENDEKMKSVEGNGKTGHVNAGYVSENSDTDIVRANNARVRLENEKESNCSTGTNGALKPENDLVKSRVLNGHVRGSMTPEPRLKAKGRLYEKNEKLTASNSSHLDKISLKIAKPSHHHINGFSPIVVLQHETIRDPLLPAAEVASIPKDGNLRDFSVQQMVTIFRLLNVPEEVVHRLSDNNIDGKRFSMFADKDLKTLGILNPIVCYFRDRSVQQTKKQPNFML